MALRERLIRRKHAKPPQRKAGSHGGVLGVVSGSGSQLAARDLKKAKVRGALEPVAHDDQLDLCENEAVAAAVLAHDVMQVRQATQVLYALDVALDAHASVEAVERLDEADNASGRLAAEDGGRGGSIARNGGDKHLLGVAGGVGSGLRRNSELEGAVGRERQGGIQLGQVVVGVDAVQGLLVLRVALRRGGGGQEGGGHGAGEQAGGRAVGKRHDRAGVERGPWADLAHIPPEVLGMRVAQGERDGAHQTGRRVGGGEVVEESGLAGGRADSRSLVDALDRLHWLRLRCRRGSAGCSVGLLLLLLRLLHIRSKVSTGRWQA